MKNVLAALLKTMVTVALFYLLFRKVDFHEFWATLRTARFNLLLLGFAVLCVGHYVCLFRWRLLMRPLGAPVAYQLASSNEDAADRRQDGQTLQRLSDPRPRAECSVGFPGNLSSQPIPGDFGDLAHFRSAAARSFNLVLSGVCACGD